MNTTKVIWEDLDFKIVVRNRVIARGYINEDFIKGISSQFIEKAEDLLRIVGLDIEKSKRKILETIERHDLANFLFIRSIFDYGGVAPSHVFGEIMLKLYKERPFLFRPTDSRWEHIATTEMEIPLLPIAGLHRTKFEDIAKWWINIIKFLSEKCNGNASEFFIKMANEYNIKLDDPYALEKLHLRFMKEKRRGFPYGDKNGRLMVCTMSQSRRGFGVLKGVRPEHLKSFNMPVNSQVIRVSLNSGLIKFAYVEAREYKITIRRKGEEEEIKGLGIGLDEIPFVEICQKAWKIIASKLDIYPIDLDIYIWSIGTILCKRFGRLCSLCPLWAVCESVKRGYVGESRGVEWFKGCFSLAKPQLKAFAIIRTCNYCPDYINGICKRDEKYKVRMIAHHKLRLLREILFHDT